jgi:Mg2+ and Co2+ transporter CorA
MTAGIRILGLLLLALGITFLIWGMNISEGFADRFMKQMAGKNPEDARHYIFGGITMMVLGAGILATSFFRRKR